MKTWKNTWFMLKWVYRCTPGFFWATIAEGLVWGCIHSFTGALFLKLLFDMIETARPFEHILILVGCMGLFFALAYVFHEWYWKLTEPKIQQLLYQRMQQPLFEKAMMMDLASYDNPEFYNNFVWAVRESDKRALAVAKDFGKVINRVVASGVIIGILSTVDPLIVAVICSTVAISVAIRMLQAKLIFRKEEELRPIQRKISYINRVFYLAEYAKELRMSNAKDLLLQKHTDAMEASNKIHRGYSRRFFSVGILRSLVTSTFFDIGVMLLLVYKISVEKSITLGDFAASVSATWRLFGLIQNLMQHLTAFKEHSLYTEKFRTFLDCEITVRDSPDAVDLTEEIDEISLQNVTFTYPGSDKAALRNVSLTIPKRGKIAIVGRNGSGKTTLVKLITRMYNPTEGMLLINGRPVTDFTISSLRKQIGITFQDYKIYAATVAENICMDLVSDSDRELLPGAAEVSGLTEKVRALPRGYDTELTREFSSEGTVLSGGEQQKIAVSRAFVRNYDLMILDEPSAALDPVIEYELNQKLAETIPDKTVILISHRLSTVCMADKIYMMEDGKIVEEGTHQELMQLDGKYADMFRVQAEKYQEGYHATKNS